MAVTQYIGSRYVPLLADPVEWSAEKEYEPLTIVTHEGNSYTSRQFVPVGISIDNENFWALTGNYNAQVEQYRREVASVVQNSQSGFVAPNNFTGSADFFDAIDSGSIGTIPDGISLDASKFYDKSQIMSVFGDVTGGKIVLSDNDEVTSGVEDYGYLDIPSGSAIVTNGCSLASACVDTTRGDIVACFHVSDTRPFVIARLVDADGLITVGTESVISNLSTHCNSMTYNRRTDCFYIPARPINDVVYEFSAATLTYNRTINVDFGDIIRSFAYDADNNIYYAIGNAYVKMLDANFNVIGTLSTSYDAIASHLSDYVTYHQDCTVINGNLVQLVALTPSNSSIFTKYAIVQYRFNGDVIINTYQAYAPSQEAEAIFMRDDYIYVMLSRGRFCPVSRIAAKPLSDNGRKQHVVILKAGDDMNQLKTPGFYFCGDAATAGQLLNLPISAQGFSMQVIPYYTGNYVYQFYTGINTKWVRRYNYQSNEWTTSGAPLLFGKSGALGNSFYGYDFYETNQVHAFASVALPLITQWTAVGQMFVSSSDLSIPLPTYDGTSITHYTISATAGASNAFVMPCSFRISGDNILFRILSPVQYTTQTITLRLMLDFTYS